VIAGDCLVSDSGQRVSGAVVDGARLRARDIEQPGPASWRADQEEASVAVARYVGPFGHQLEPRAHVETSGWHGADDARSLVRESRDAYRRRTERPGERERT